MTALGIAESWFERRSMPGGVTLLRESHVHPFLRCNIWHVRGAERDLVIDTGLGLRSLVAAAPDLFAERPITAVATHAHIDHVGGLYEFNERLAHAKEARILKDGMRCSLQPWEASFPYASSLTTSEGIPPSMLSALPSEGFDAAAYHVRPAAPTRVVRDGDRVVVGDRGFEVLHLPGHSPGSIGLWEIETGTLFSGDAIYDGRLLDDLPGSHVPDYIGTMRRLMRLPVTIVHAGHETSFDAIRLRAIANEYLATRR